MDRPAGLFDREAEWGELSEFATSVGARVRLAVVRGRRRHGKSYLLRPLAEQAGGFYYQAVTHERRLALEDFGAKLAGRMVLRAPLRFDNWEAALDQAFALSPDGDGPLVVVIDEFPYLLDHSPELPSLLQRTIDQSSNKDGRGVRLVVCGSALSVMATLLEGTQALRGRAVVDEVVRAFDFRVAARFWGIADPRVAFSVHAVVGGAPGYLDMLGREPPGSMTGFDDWIERGVLNPSSALFREDDYLLTEERGLSHRALYHSVIVAIAGGATRLTEVAATLGRPASALTYPLRQLEDAGFVVKDEDALRNRRPVYRLADPILRFHHVVTRRDLARFEARRTSEAWADAQQRFSTHVLGPQFEQTARDYTFRYAPNEVVGHPVAEVGTTVVNDRLGRARHQVDVVALARTSDGSKRLLAIGEAKHTNRPVGAHELERLERIRALIEAEGTRSADGQARLLLFSASGFTDDLERTVEHRTDVSLLGLAELYGTDSALQGPRG